MSDQDAHAVLETLLSGALPVEQAASLLVTLSERGETSAELAAFVNGLLQRAIAVPIAGGCIDICGTGGSGLTRFNVSTTVAFILAAAGIPVAKHGNRGSQRKNGSFDLLEALGVPFQFSAEALQRIQKKSGVCFLFARLLHPGMAAVAPARKAAGRRTIFNLAGPLANPSRPSTQIIGVANRKNADVVAGALAALGVERACVVWGEPGIDEFSVTGSSTVVVIENGRRSESTFQPLHPNVRHEQLPGGECDENVKIFTRLLAGKERGPLLDMVLVNAGAAIDLWQRRPLSPQGEGYHRAAELMRSGAVSRAFERHREAALHEEEMKD
jgi:anthranilate phosphoribosyltransferase